jgi:hypothetical protein
LGNSCQEEITQHVIELISLLVNNISSAAAEKKEKRILFIAPNQNEVRFGVKSFCEGEDASPAP